MSSYREERSRRRTPEVKKKPNVKESRSPSLDSEGDSNNDVATGMDESTSGELVPVSFEVPPTRDGAEMLMNIFDVSTIISWTLAVLAVVVTVLPQDVSIAVYIPALRGTPLASLVGVSDEAVIAVSVFWRLAYNLGLGALLRWQSKYNGMTKFLQVARRWPLAKAAIDRMISLSLPEHGSSSGALDAYPLCFNAWVFMMQIVNVVLPNDVLGFFLVAYRCYLRSFGDHGTFCEQWIASFGFERDELLPDVAISISCETLRALRYAAIVLGVTMFVVSAWGKANAHRVIGHYAWFWGDFFYAVDLQLKFDGIFEIVPHAMYTVGYAWMYGFALLVWSWDLLALAFVSHFAQMLFLEFVENPHIEKLYAVQKSPSEVEAFKTRHRANIFVVTNFDALRPSDWMVGIIAIQLAVVTCMLPIETAVGLTISCRIIGTAIVGTFLRQQSKSKFWTRRFIMKGASAQEAFDNWIRIYNVIDSSMNVSLIICAARFFRAESYVELWQHPEGGPGVVAAYVCMAISFLWISHWALTSSYEILGDKGWFFGDFFLPVQKQKNLYGEGIFRYVTNPDILLGKLWLYALVIFTRSSTVFILAITAHIASYVLLVAVEKPHMRQIYAPEALREHSTMATEKLHRKMRRIRAKMKRQFSAIERAQYYRFHNWFEN